MIEALVAAGVTHVVGIPDNGSAALYDVASRDERLRVLTVTREGEAFAVASGLWLGGAVPVVVVQNTGLLESGDSLRGTAMRMGVPLLIVVGYRGHARMGEGETDCTTARLQRGDQDSVALLTEPTLDAWRISYDWLEPGGERAVVGRARSEAERRQAPVAILVRGNLVEQPVVEV